MTEPAKVTTDIVEAASRLPILSDPDVRAALEKVTRAALEELAAGLLPVLERARELPEEVALIPCDSEEEHDFLRAWLAQEVDGAEHRAKELIEPYSTCAHRVHRAFTALRALVTDETAKARGVAKDRILAYARRVEQERREAAERARREREEAEHLAVIRRTPYLLHVAIAQAAETAEDEREKREAAERARAAGDHEAADAITGEIGKPSEPTIQPDPGPALPEVLPPPRVPEKPRGIARNYKARLRRPFIDLVRFVAARPEWEGLLALNEPNAHKAAKLHEDKLSQIVPPLEAWNDPTVRKTRGRK